MRGEGGWGDVSWGGVSKGVGGIYQGDLGREGK